MGKALTCSPFSSSSSSFRLSSCSVTLSWALDMVLTPVTEYSTALTPSLVADVLDDYDAVEVVAGQFEDLCLSFVGRQGLRCRCSCSVGWRQRWWLNVVLLWYLSIGVKPGVQIKVHFGTPQFSKGIKRKILNSMICSFVSIFYRTITFQFFPKCH